MTADWFLIQYSAELRRHEPRNIGVVVESDGSYAMRLVGVREDGSVNGRQLRAFHGLSAETLKSWVHYYKSKIEADQWHVATGLHLRRLVPLSVVKGGVDLSARRVEDIADSLFVELVQPEREAATNYLRLLQDRTEAVIQKSQVEPESEVIAEADWGHGKTAQVPFDYRYENGQVHYFQRLQLHQKTEEDAATIAQAFNARVNAARSAQAAKSFVAFYSQEAIDELGDRILFPIWTVAESIDVDDETVAIEKLNAVVGY